MSSFLTGNVNINTLFNTGTRTGSTNYILGTTDLSRSFAPYGNTTNFKFP